jgi:hypothetical protein
MLLPLPLPQINVGKGGDWLFDHLMGRYQIQPSRTAMIGDRLDTDIAMGKQGGLVTLLPLTGELESSYCHVVPCDSNRRSCFCHTAGMGMPSSQRMSQTHAGVPHGRHVGMPSS